MKADKILWSENDCIDMHTYSRIFISYPNALGYGIRKNQEQKDGIIKIKGKNMFNFLLVFYKAFTYLSTYTPKKFNIKIVSTKNYDIYLKLSQQEEADLWNSKHNWNLNLIKMEGTNETRIVFTEPSLFEYAQGKLGTHLLHTIEDKNQYNLICNFLITSGLRESRFKIFEMKNNLHNELLLLTPATTNLSTPLRNYVNREYLTGLLKPDCYLPFKKNFRFYKYLDLITNVAICQIMYYEFHDLDMYIQALIYESDCSRCGCKDCDIIHIHDISNNG